jgi:prepilin-type N-terminal cleavage/methylation domain-containing protein
MYVSNQKKKMGYSLTEVIIAMFIFSIVMVAVSAVFTKGFSAHRYAKNLQRDVENMQYLMGILSKELRTGTIVSSDRPESTDSVQFFDHSQDLCIGYRISAGSLQVAREASSGPSFCKGISLSGYTAVSTGGVTGRFHVVPSDSSPRTVGKVTFVFRIQEDVHSVVIQSTVSLRDFGSEGSNL